MEFHEPTGLAGYRGGSSKKFFETCETCGKSFNSLDLLTLHRIEQHPSPEPRLFIRGYELGASTLKVRTPLQRSEIMFSHEGEIKLNGRTVLACDVIEAICTATQQTFDLTLGHVGMHRKFQIDLRIPDESDLIGVERSVSKLIAGGRLDRRGINQLTSDCEDFRTAREYLGGIVNYFYGVLAREESPETELQFEQHEERLNRSASQLAGYQRPLSMCLCAVISFVGNHFKMAANQCPQSRVAAAARSMASLVTGKIGEEGVISSLHAVVEDQKFTDIDTERLIRWAVVPATERVEYISEMESAFKTMKSAFDRSKLAILIASSAQASGERGVAIKYANHLRSSPEFGEWADRFFKNI
jgi:hypothetical protein